MRGVRWVWWVRMYAGWQNADPQNFLGVSWLVRPTKWPPKRFLEVTPCTTTNTTISTTTSTTSTNTNTITSTTTNTTSSTSNLTAFDSSHTWHHSIVWLRACIIQVTAAQQAAGSRQHHWGQQWLLIKWRYLKSLKLLAIRNGILYFNEMFTRYYITHATTPVWITKYYWWTGVAGFSILILIQTYTQSRLRDSCACEYP